MRCPVFVGGGVGRVWSPFVAPPCGRREREEFRHEGRVWTVGGGLRSSGAFGPVAEGVPERGAATREALRPSARQARRRRRPRLLPASDRRQTRLAKHGQPAALRDQVPLRDHAKASPEVPQDHPPEEDQKTADRLERAGGARDPEADSGCEDQDVHDGDIRLWAPSSRRHAPQGLAHRRRPNVPARRVRPRRVRFDEGA